MNTETLQIRDAIHKNIVGIIWITDELLIDRPKYFSELDYFLDGLLTMHLQRTTKEKKELLELKNFFVTNNFEHSFFLAHLFSKKEDLSEDIKELIPLIQKLKTIQESKILIINQPKSEIIKTIQTKFPDFLFETIEE